MWWKRKRLVRVHLVGDEPSVEGVYIGRVDGHYRLEQASVIESAERSHTLEGWVLIPARKVAFVQVLTEGATR